MPRNGENDLVVEVACLRVPTLFRNENKTFIRLCKT